MSAIANRAHSSRTNYAFCTRELVNRGMSTACHVLTGVMLTGVGITHTFNISFY